MTSYYKLRINCVAKPEEYTKMEEKYFIKFMKVKEKVLENPHYHYYLTTLSSRKSITDYIKRHIGKDCSHTIYSMIKVREENPLEYLAYLYKEDDCPLIRGIPDDVLEKAKLYDLSVKQVLKDRKKTYDHVYKYVLEKTTKRNDKGNPPPKQIVKKVADYFAQAGRSVSSRQIENLAGQILWNIDSQYKKEKVSDILDNLKTKAQKARDKIQLEHDIMILQIKTD